MAVYLVELVTVDEATRRRAIAMLPARYPEIELVVPTGGDLAEVDHWAVRASGPAHVAHWCRDAGLPAPSVDRVDAAPVAQSSEPTDEGAPR